MLMWRQSKTAASRPWNTASDTVSARLFLALRPDAPVRQQLVQWRDGWRWPRSATPVATERLHMTLHFIGAVGRPSLPALMQTARVPFEAFTLQFGRNEMWHRGLAVLEPHAIPLQLAMLHARLAAAIVDVGLSADTRPYRPHVTLARRADNATVAHAGPALVWPVTGYALMESTPQDGYTVLAHYP